MHNHPLVSILIPTYNRAQYLAEALESALAQTYTNLEIIVHDDASTDSTPQLLKNYSDPRLRVIRTKKNHGMIGGWNYIVKKAHGEYLKFLASDDLLHPNCVAELAAAAIDNPRASLIGCRRQFINRQGRGVRELGFAKYNKTVSGKTLAKQILTTLRENSIGEPSAVLYPVKNVKKVGEYDPAFSQFADFEYWVRLLEFGDFVYINRTLCSFRQHEASGSTAAQRDGRFITEIFRLINKYYHNQQFKETFSLSDSDLKQVTRQKTLDTLKNIKDLVLAGKLRRAHTYYRRLSGELNLSYLVKVLISHLTK